MMRRSWWLPPSLWWCSEWPSLWYLRYQHRQRPQARTRGTRQTTRSSISVAPGSCLQPKWHSEPRPDVTARRSNPGWGSGWRSVGMSSTQVAGGVFGCRARKDLVFAHGPLFDAVTGSPKRLADLDRAPGRRRFGDGTRPDARCRPGTAGASAPRHRRFPAARSGTEDGSDSPRVG